MLHHQRWWRCSIYTLALCQIQIMIYTTPWFIFTIIISKTLSHITTMKLWYTNFWKHVQYESYLSHSGKDILECSSPTPGFRMYFPGSLNIAIWFIKKEGRGVRNRKRKISWYLIECIQISKFHHLPILEQSRQPLSNQALSFLLHFPIPGKTIRLVGIVIKSKKPFHFKNKI